MKIRSLRDSSVNVIDMNDVTNRMREPMNMIIIPGPATERVSLCNITDWFIVLCAGLLVLLIKGYMFLLSTSMWISVHCT